MTARTHAPSAPCATAFAAPSVTSRGTPSFALAAAFAVALVAALAATAPRPASAQAAAPAPAAQPAVAPRAGAAELGRREFEDNCATCHGMEARGDGPMRPFLVRPPTDLTTLAQRNGGTFPRTRIADLIDGRGQEQPGSHGTRDMPVWGRVYREQSEAQTRGTPFPAEWSVRGRIVALVDYLQTLQRP
ncbi:MAG: cytochrome c [Burkholderiaceae bacterium]|jgi:mono/diheme cytochrome c family protein|nr:cytochrome c [Burkholderiaceae bacterium]